MFNEQSSVNWTEIAIHTSWEGDIKKKFFFRRVFISRRTFLFIESNLATYQIAVDNNTFEYSNEIISSNVHPRSETPTMRMMARGSLLSRC